MAFDRLEPAYDHIIDLTTILSDDPRSTITALASTHPQSRTTVAMPGAIDILRNIPLHSPTPIVGTPFDLRKNFEYPFPPDHAPHPCEPDRALTLPAHPSNVSVHAVHTTHPLPTPAAAPRAPLARTNGHASARTPASPHTHTNGAGSPGLSPPALHTHSHPKMRTREPPVPPGLITKRRRVSEMEAGRGLARSPSTSTASTGSEEGGAGSADGHDPDPEAEDGKAREQEGRCFVLVYPAERGRVVCQVMEGGR